jgi:hypothetical protein
MAVFIAALLFFFMSSVGTQAQTNWEYLEQSPERILGLLNLPEIVGDGCGASQKRASARVFSLPSANGTHVGTIYMRDEGNAGCWLTVERTAGSKEQAPTLESGYEIAAAIVYERRGSWFRIALSEGSAWIRRSDSTDFLPYPEILRENLSHIQQGWDAKLRDTPGSSGKIKSVPPGWTARSDQHIDIEFLSSRRVGNELWIHVQLMTERCGQTVEGVAITTGWIPAYRANRSPSAWFSSRGC